MKQLNLKSFGMLTLMLISGASQLTAQSDAGNILKAGSANANKLINAYLGRGLDATGQGLNDGWVNTGKPLGALGLDLRLNAGMSLIPVKDQSFDFNALFPSRSGTYLMLEGDESTKRPTLYGDDAPSTTKVLVRSNIGGTDSTLSSFTLPSGTGFSNSPSLPILQLSIGFPANTEVMIRHVPRMSVGGVNMGLFGMGVKHDIVQWIPKYRKLDVNGVRPFDLSVFAAFTNFNSVYSKQLLTLDPAAYNPTPASYDNQKITVELTSWTAGAIISKDFRLWSPSSGISPYLGINYSSSTSHFLFSGTYPIPGANDEYGSAHPQAIRIQKTTDPVNINRSVNTMRMNIGMRVKLAALTMSGEYSIGAFNSFTVSLAANIQSINPFKL
jgi:hypothetical protein